MASLASVLQTIALAVLWRTAQRMDGPAQWALGGALLAMGTILIALRHIIPDALSIVLANTLIVGSHAAYLFGIQHYRGLPQSRVTCMALLAAMLGLFAYFTYLSPDISARVILISAVVAGLSLVCAFQFFRRKQRPFAAAELLLVVLLGLHAGFHLFRGVYTALAEPEITDFMNASLIHGMAFVDVVIFSFAVGIGFSVATVLTMNEALQVELEDRSALLSIIAHDVRTPFNGLVGSTHLIQANLEKGKIEETRRFADLLSHEAEGVLRLLEDLVTWGRTQFADAAVSNQTFSLRDLVDDVLEPLRKQADAKRISLEIAVDDESILADRNIVAMALRNFLSNAIKYSPQGSTIRTESKTAATGIELTVLDEGPGLDPKRLRNGALETRDLSATTATGETAHYGLGVGLSLCARTCARHGYELRISNRPEGGVSARLRIPAV